MTEESSVNNNGSESNNKIIDISYVTLKYSAYPHNMDKGKGDEILKPRPFF